MSYTEQYITEVAVPPLSLTFISPYISHFHWVPTHPLPVPAPVTVAVFCPFTQVGKRRGGNKLALKTGIVAKKQKTEDEVLTSKGDAWAKYMAEVKKYKAHQCGDDDKTRPLVK